MIDANSTIQNTIMNCYKVKEIVIKANLEISILDLIKGFFKFTNVKTEKKNVL